MVLLGGKNLRLSSISQLLGRPKRGRPALLLLALGLLTALVLSACGSSGGSSSSSSGSETGSSETGGSETSGEPIGVMGLGTFEGTVAYPEAPPAFEAQVQKINEAGGIEGREIDLTICNDQGNPQVASHCAQEAVEKHDVAVMGSYSVQAAAFLPILESAHIAYIGADASQTIEETSPNSFPLENQYQLYGSVGYAAGTKGCRKAALITENYGAATMAEDEVSDKAFENSPDGEEVIKRVEVGSSNTDYAPPVATMLSAGAECIIAPLPPEELPKLISSIEQSSDPEATVAVTANSVPAEELKSLGSQAEGMLVGSAGYVPGAAESPKSVTETIEQIEAFDSSAEINAFSLTATAAVKTVAHVLEELKGEISAESFLKGAGEIEEFETGLAAPFTTTKPGPIPGKPRLFTMQVLAYEVINGVETPITKEFVNLGPTVFAG
jgi:branched-chain amino acid transport system substrate-binding protein